jgi:hypothetical protein
MAATAHRRARRRLLLAALLAPLYRSAAAGDEAALRETIARYVAAWNAHDVKAWTVFLAADVWFTRTIDHYESNKGRDQVVAMFAWDVENSDLDWEVRRINRMPDGSATVVLKNRTLLLPKSDGKYRMVFEHDPAASRWRLEDGQWRMFFFTSDRGWALDVLKKDGVE